MPIIKAFDWNVGTIRGRSVHATYALSRLRFKFWCMGFGIKVFIRLLYTICTNFTNFVCTSIVIDFQTFHIVLAQIKNDKEKHFRALFWILFWIFNYAFEELNKSIGEFAHLTWCSNGFCWVELKGSDCMLSNFMNENRHKVASMTFQCNSKLN